MFAKTLKHMGTKRALIVHGNDGMDEITLSDETCVAELTESGEIKEYTLSPEDFGFKRCDKEAVMGGDAEQNAKIIEALLNGETGDKHNLVSLNAGAALYVAGKADSIAAGVAMASEILMSGKAMDALIAMRTVSQGAVS